MVLGPNFEPVVRFTGSQVSLGEMKVIECFTPLGSAKTNCVGFAWRSPVPLLYSKDTVTRANWLPASGLMNWSGGTFHSTFCTYTMKPSSLAQGFGEQFVAFCALCFCAEFTAPPANAMHAPNATMPSTTINPHPIRTFLRP